MKNLSYKPKIFSMKKVSIFFTFALRALSPIFISAHRAFTLLIAGSF
jgi:hypothetical protein